MMQHPDIWEKIKSKDLNTSLTLLGEYFNRPVGHLLKDVAAFRIVKTLDRAINVFDNDTLTWKIGETAVGPFELYFAGDGCYDVIMWNKSSENHVKIGNISPIEAGWIGSRYINGKLKTMRAREQHVVITYLQNLFLKYEYDHKHSG